MHLGMIMECDYRPGGTQEDAFREAFSLAQLAEETELSGVWLAERHFAAPKGELDASGAGIPSIASVPLVLASAIAARTERLRIGVAVAVLPLSHPIRMAEEAATVDHISLGRLDFGVGRSSFARAYEGYGIPYAESRERFEESLEVIVKAWTQERFSHEGKYFTFDDVSVLPKPYQKPHPPIRMAANTPETFANVGGKGLPLFVGLRGYSVPDVARHLEIYREALREAGYPDDPDVLLRIPMYVAETAERAVSEPEDSTMRSYRRMADSLTKSASVAGATASEQRAQRGRRLSNVSYQDLLRERLAYGTPEMVAEKLGELKTVLGLSGFVIEPNVGGAIPAKQVFNSVRLFAQDVAPLLR